MLKAYRYKLEPEASPLYIQGTRHEKTICILR